jgi:hypothetical protein
MCGFDAAEAAAMTAVRRIRTADVNKLIFFMDTFPDASFLPRTEQVFKPFRNPSPGKAKRDSKELSRKLQAPDVDHGCYNKAGRLIFSKPDQARAPSRTRKAGMRSDRNRSGEASAVGWSMISRFSSWDISSFRRRLFSL